MPCSRLFHTPEGHWTFYPLAERISLPPVYCTTPHRFTSSSLLPLLFYIEDVQPGVHYIGDVTCVACGADKRSATYGVV